MVAADVHRLPRWLPSVNDLWRSQRARTVLPIHPVEGRAVPVGRAASEFVPQGVFDFGQPPLLREKYRSSFAAVKLTHKIGVASSLARGGLQ